MRCFVYPEFSHIANVGLRRGSATLLAHYQEAFGIVGDELDEDVDMLDNEADDDIYEGIPS